MYQILPDSSSLPGKSRIIGSDWGVTPPMYRPGQGSADVTPHPHPISRLGSQFLGIHGSTHRTRFIGSDWGVTPPMYRPGQAPADVTPLPHSFSRLGSQFLGIHGSTHRTRFIGSGWQVTPPMYRPGQAPADVTPLPHPVSRLGSQFLGLHGSTHRPAHLIYQILPDPSSLPGKSRFIGSDWGGDPANVPAMTGPSRRDPPPASSFPARYVHVCLCACMFADNEKSDTKSHDL